MQEYELSFIKPGDFKDQNNNYWVDATFVGFGEPVKIVTPNPSNWEVGKKYYGEILEQTSKSGRPYYRFKRSNQAPTATQALTSNFRDDSAIKAQFAIKASVQLLQNPQAEVSATTIEHWANIFYDMVDRVKNHKPQGVVVNEVPNTVTMEDIPLEFR